MNYYICGYEYRGQDTEGNLVYEEHSIVKAVNKSHALYIYDLIQRMRRGEPYDKYYKDYIHWLEKQGESYTGSWGEYCYELSDKEKLKIEARNWELQSISTLRYNNLLSVAYPKGIE